MRLAKLRILMTTDSVGGIWTYASDLADALAASGAIVRVLVLGPRPAAELRAAAVARGIDLHPMDHTLEWLAETPGEIVAASEAIATEARRFGADVVHLHAPAYAAEAAYPCPVVVVAHACVATWWSAVQHGSLPPAFAWNRAMTEAGLRRASAVIAPSEAFAVAVTRTYGLERAPSVVRNGRRRDPERGRGAQRDEVFTAGRLWDQGKGIRHLDAAAPRVAWRVRAAGALAGVNGERIAPQAIDVLGLLGPDVVRRRLAARPIFVAPALYEPFGLSVLEAAQAGCALVLSDIPTFRELWDGAALFCEATDPAALAAALTAVIEDPPLRARLGAASSERSEAYGLEAMLDGTLAVFERVARANADTAVGVPA